MLANGSRPPHVTRFPFIFFESSHLRVLPPRPLDEVAQAAIAALIAVVEADTTRRLQAGAGSSSSSSSTRSAQPSLMGPPLPLPLPASVAQLPPPPLDVSTSLLNNVRRLLETRLGRPMTQAERDALDAGLVEALGVLRYGTDAEHHAALRSVALTALSTSAGAQLWACVLAEVESGVRSVGRWPSSWLRCRLPRAPSAAHSSRQPSACDRMSCTY
jgi:hypothetical protein